MTEITTCIMNIAFTVFAVYGWFVAHKWNKAAREFNAFVERARKEMESDG